MLKGGLVWCILSILVLALFVFAVPEGGNHTLGDADTRLPSGAESRPTQGANNTNLSVTAQTQTTWWQGFWGSISVDPTLQDAAGNHFYNWSRYNVTAGEVYFINASSQIFDSNITNATNENMTYAQTVYGWANSSGSDNLTNTYNVANGHQDFFFDTEGGFPIEINASTAPAVNMEAGLFNGTILWDSDYGGYPIFVALVNPDQSGFNTRTVDFQALIPTRGAKSTEIFYVYLELS